MFDKKFIRIIIFSIINLIASFYIYKYFYKTKKIEIKYINICMAVNDEKVYTTLILITSIIENSKNYTNYNIHLLAESTTSKNTRLILRTLEVKYKNLNINIIEINDEMLNFIDNKKIKINYYKFLIPIFVPNINKIIYIDDNLLAIKDISDLFDINNIDNYYYLGNLDNNFEEEINIYIKNRKSPLINSNLLLINLEKIRKDKIYEKEMLFIRRNANNLDILYKLVINILCDENINLLQNTSNIFLNYNNTMIYNKNNNDNNNNIVKYWWYYAKLTSYYNEIKNYYK